MEQIVKDTTANPVTLSLFGFGMTTILLNIHNAGFFELNAMIMGMALFFGGMQQVIAMATFTSYGFFWISIVTLWLLPLVGVTKSDGVPLLFMKRPQSSSAKNRGEKYCPYKIPIQFIYKRQLLNIYQL